MVGPRDEVSQTLQTGTTTLQAVAGTPHFMSPEQFDEGATITPKTDLWSLGVVIFQSLSGQLPFAPDESEWVKIAFAIVHKEPAHLSDAIEVVGGVSDAMSEFTHRALQKDMQGFGTAAEMEAALWELE